MIFWKTYNMLPWCFGKIHYRVLHTNTFKTQQMHPNYALLLMEHSLTMAKHKALILHAMFSTTNFRISLKNTMPQITRIGAFGQIVHIIVSVSRFWFYISFIFRVKYKYQLFGSSTVFFKTLKSWSYCQLSISNHHKFR